ncbi:hypothetical protein PGT21_034863 [Puccinia graminis f. sp. tritici]|uniref:Uncharacterized protein n=1 Tax=Puccinia graminis f. sp. tritici TaxID=56615 RepID=A0A5B0MQV8_PUCGR|nr:hypothetical protein PGT21_034863 [Puccinia graminis f. sp. tritici]
MKHSCGNQLIASLVFFCILKASHSIDSIVTNKLARNGEVTIDIGTFEPDSGMLSPQDSLNKGEQDKLKKYAGSVPQFRNQQGMFPDLGHPHSTLDDFIPIQESLSVIQDQYAKMILEKKNERIQDKIEFLEDKKQFNLKKDKKRVTHRIFKNKNIKKKTEFGIIIEKLQSIHSLILGEMKKRKGKESQQNFDFMSVDNIQDSQPELLQTIKPASPHELFSQTVALDTIPIHKEIDEVMKRRGWEDQHV